MATTAVGAGLRVQQWDDEFFVEFVRTNKFARYIGKTENSLIQMKENLEKKAGDSVTFQMIGRLQNSAVRGASTLSGNEEALNNRSQRVYVELIRNGVEIDVKVEQIKTEIDLRNAARSALKTWAMNTLRSDVVAALSSIDGVAYGSASAGQRNTWLTNNADRVLYGAAKSNASSNVHATALATIDSTNDKLTPAAVSLAKRIAKSADPHIRPIRVDEDGEWFVLFTGSRTFRDLKENSDMRTAHREAMERGKSNPLFVDGDLVYDGIIIREIEDIPVIAGVGASSIDVGPSYLCGAQALGIAYAQRTKSVEDTPQDYGRLRRVGIEEIRKVEKLRFGTDASVDTTTPKDFGVVTLFHAAVADA